MVQITKDDILNACAEILECAPTRLSIEFKTKTSVKNLPRKKGTLYFIAKMSYIESNTDHCDCPCQLTGYLNTKEVFSYDLINYKNLEFMTYYDKGGFVMHDINMIVEELCNDRNPYNCLTLTYFEIKRI